MATETQYLFIDGNSLRVTVDNVSRRYFDGEPIVLRWASVKDRARKAFYYDALPVKTAEEDENAYFLRTNQKRQELSAIEREDGFHVRTGDALYRKKRGNEQKMVDVQLAVDALLQASRGLFSACTLITGDLDFRPLINALVEMGINVHLVYPPSSVNDELLAAADFVSPLTVVQVVNWSKNITKFRDRLPIHSMQDRHGAVDRGDLVSIWLDPRYGECRILRSDNGLIMVSSIHPDYPDSRLYVDGKDGLLLRNYLEDMFDMSPPEWTS